MPRLFSYGTLQREEVQRATFKRKLDGHPDELAGGEPALVEITDPAVAAALGRTHHADVRFTGDLRQRVAGMVFEVSEDELAAADIYERSADYVRIVCTLTSGVEAWVYVHRSSRPRQHT